MPFFCGVMTPSLTVFGHILYEWCRCHRCHLKRDGVQSVLETFCGPPFAEPSSPFRRLSLFCLLSRFHVVLNFCWQWRRCLSTVQIRQNLTRLDSVQQFVMDAHQQDFPLAGGRFLCAREVERSRMLSPPSTLGVAKHHMDSNVERMRVDEAWNQFMWPEGLGRFHPTSSCFYTWQVGWSLYSGELWRCVLVLWISR